MANRQFALVAALLPAIAFATANVTWNASAAADKLLAAAAISPSGIAAGIEASAASISPTTVGTKLDGLALTPGSLTAIASGPQVTGKFTLTMASSTEALKDSQFPRWIAKAFSVIMECHENQVDVWLKAARRLSTDGRRLTATVSGTYTVYNPNRGRNIGLGIGLGLVAPAVGLGAGLGLGLDRDGKKAPAPTSEPSPVTPAPSIAPVTTTAAPQEGSSMPLWAGILLALACLACIGAAIFFSMDKGKKKKAPKKKAAPVKPVEEVKIVEEVAPLVLEPTPQIVQQPVQYVQQPVTYTSVAAPISYASQPVYAAPPVAYQQVGGSVRMF